MSHPQGHRGARQAHYAMGNSILKGKADQVFPPGQGRAEGVRWGRGTMKGVLKDLGGGKKKKTTTSEA